MSRSDIVSIKYHILRTNNVKSREILQLVGIVQQVASRQRYCLVFFHLLYMRYYDFVALRFEL